MREFERAWQRRVAEIDFDKLGRMPVEMVRARLLKLKLPRDRAQWRFYGEPIVQSDDK